MHYAMLLTIVTMLSAGIALGQSSSIQVDGQTRTFLYHIPSGLPDHPALILSMHGLGGSGSQQQSMSGFNTIADREKFIVVYPNGIYQFNGSNGWDVSSNADADFLAALIDTMTARYHCDPARVYACGFSMGGMVSYRLACAHPEKLAAIGPCAGYNPCSPKAPVSIIHVHGTKDQAVAYSGLSSIISRWVSFNGCPQTPQVTKPYPASNPNSMAWKQYWGPCTKEGTEIVVLTVDSMTHAWPGGFGSSDIKASEEYWAFFKTHPKGGVAETSQAGYSIQTKQPVWAGYCAGNITVRSTQVLRSIRAFDIQGKILFAWNSGTNSFKRAAFPINQTAGGIYLVTILDVAGHTTVRLAIP
ncbi:MAG: hypothetical protein JW768_16510 [Chitinispirillaceae bacterium]|nr:hypothetical protein [Chitinispirillaceae bacterium]